MYCLVALLPKHSMPLSYKVLKLTDYDFKPSLIKGQSHVRNILLKSLELKKKIKTNKQHFPLNG